MHSQGELGDDGDNSCGVANHSYLGGRVLHALPHLHNWVLGLTTRTSPDITAFTGTAVMSVGRSGEEALSHARRTSASEDGGGSADHLGSLPLIVVIR